MSKIVVDQEILEKIGHIMRACEDYLDSHVTLGRSVEFSLTSLHTLVFDSDFFYMQRVEDDNLSYGGVDASKDLLKLSYDNLSDFSFYLFEEKRFEEDSDTFDIVVRVNKSKKLLEEI